MFTADLSYAMIACLFQSSLLILIGLVVSRCFRWHAAGRHTVLLLTLASISLLPVAITVFQRSDLSLLPIDNRNSFNIERNGEESSFGPEIPPNSGTLIVPSYSDPSDSASITAVPANILRVGVLVWGAGALVLLARTVTGLIYLARDKRKFHQRIDESLTALADRLSKQIGLGTSPPVYYSNEVRVPVAVAVGVLRPAILLPNGLADRLTPNQLADILLHELAHIKRHDHLVLVFQKLVSAMLWPQPLLPILNRELSRAREEICDNYVLLNTGRIGYGETLLVLTECVSSAFSLGFFGESWRLEERIMQLLSEKRSTVTKPTLAMRCLAGAVWGAMTVLVALCTPLPGDETPISPVHTELLPRLNIPKSNDSGYSASINSRGRRHSFEANISEVNSVTSLSDENKSEADRLQEMYIQLAEQQSEIASKLETLKSELKKLGVDLDASHHENAISRRAHSQNAPLSGNATLIRSNAGPATVQNRATRHARPTRFRSPRLTDSSDREPKGMQPQSDVTDKHVR